MASFSKMAVWSVGYFRSYSSWLLRHRRTIAARLKAIDAELVRIGSVTVIYRTVNQDGNIRATEERIGFKVTKNSSLERLVRAYIANGGNPLDISPFLHPESVEVTSEGDQVKIKESYPHGGILAPMSANPNDPLPIKGVDSGYGADPGGWIRSDDYLPGRQGGRISRGDPTNETVIKAMHQMRSWANQDIKERLQDIEARIIKLSDLAEQLTKERDEVLVQAFGGALVGAGLGSFDENRFPRNLQVQVLVQDFYDLLYETNESGGKEQSYKASNEVGFLPFTFDTKPSELRDPLG